MKELRVPTAGHGRTRVLFAFDPVRRAILLVGGDKSNNWSGWYARAIRLADDRFDEHLRNMVRDGEQGDHS